MPFEDACQSVREQWPRTIHQGLPDARWTDVPVLDARFTYVFCELDCLGSMDNDAARCNAEMTASTDKRRPILVCQRSTDWGDYVYIEGIGEIDNRPSFSLRGRAADAVSLLRKI